jgi:hypothetical protein
MRIVPVPVSEDDRFDSLDSIAHEEEVKEKRKGSGKRVAVITDDIESGLNRVESTKANQLGNRIKPKRKKFDIKANKAKDTQRMSLFATVQQFTVKEYLEMFIWDKSSRRLGAPFLALGLFFCGVLEVIQPSFRYNFIIFLVLAMSALFPAFPATSVRPQLCVSVATLLSFAFDIIKLSNKYQSNSGVIVLVVFQIICKLLVFNAFLRNTKGGSRTRKYLDRRLRLFFIPLRQPKRIMRDVRGRFLALGWIQLFAVLAYAMFLVVFVVNFDYAILLMSRQSGASMPIFLLFKTITSLMVLGGILYDTDIRLALFYFGCFGFYVDYIRKYLARKRIDLEGWPLAFSYYGLRFYLLCVVKIIDVMWGFYGWYLVGSNYFRGFLRIESSLQIFLTFLIYTLIVSDIWCPILFMGIRWLLKRHKKMREMKVEYVSDDSEIEEFHLREDLEPLLEDDKTKEARRLQRMEENLAKLDEVEQEKLTLLRKPSRTEIVRIKGLKPNKSLKRGAIMPINIAEKADNELDPEDVLNDPEDDYDLSRLAKTNDSNPMHSVPSPTGKSVEAVAPPSPPKRSSRSKDEFATHSFVFNKVSPLHALILPRT